MEVVANFPSVSLKIKDFKVLNKFMNKIILGIHKQAKLTTYIIISDLQTTASIYGTIVDSSTFIKPVKFCTARDPNSYTPDQETGVLTKS